jgi:hypothetical protein
MLFCFHIWYIAKFDSFSGDGHHFGYITKFSEKKKKDKKKKGVMSSILLLCKVACNCTTKRKYGPGFYATGGEEDSGGALVVTCKTCS